MNDLPYLFKITKFSEGNLYEGLSNSRISPDGVSRHRQANYLFRYLKALKAKTIVIEYEYTDGDYLDDYAAYYVKCFTPYSRFCKRLHFFSQKSSQDEFTELVCENLASKRKQTICASYLGFVVARPLPNAIIGRTTLKTYESDNGRRRYTCTRKYSANLFGIELSINSLAFQEQDTVLAACATVSLWCCFHKTTELFNTPIPTPAVITSAANQVSHYGRPIPSHGLNVQQICKAINHIGLEPEVIDIKNNIPVISLIYGYLEMGLPIILGVEIEGVGLHAITLTGYSLQEKQHLAYESDEGCLNFIGLRINEFYGHDDQVGPFSRIKIKPSKIVEGKKYPVTFEGSWNDRFGKVLALYPHVAIIPIYNKIRITFLDIQEWLTRLDKVLQLIFPVDEVHQEWDVHLTTTNRYKGKIKEVSLDQKILENILFKQHPRFIWRSIFRVNNIKVLEMLADATDMARSFPFYQAIWHYDELRNSLEELLGIPSNTALIEDILTEQFLLFLEKSTKSENDIKV